MKKYKDIEASSLLVILSILTILVQFAAYVFFDYNIVIWGIACLISIISCFILLGQTITYRICFDYSFLTIFISLVIIVLTYYGDNSDFIPFSTAMFGILLINWMIPMLHCFIKYTLDYGTTIDDFNSFYRNSSIIFLIFYTGILLYTNFAPDSYGWANAAVSDTACFTPFTIITARIQDYFNGLAPLGNIINYLAARILIYIPYGFYIFLILRRKNFLLRCLALLIMPFLIELVQYFTIQGRCDIDDLIYAFIGGLLGFLGFILTNAIYKAFSGRNFLINEETYRKYGNPLHF